MKINLKCMHVHAFMLLLGIIYIALLGLSMSAAALGVIFLVFPTYYHWLGALNVVLCRGDHFVFGLNKPSKCLE